MKTSKKILGATLALSLIIPLSGCGGSKYAVKGCKPTDNFPCVPVDENNLASEKTVDVSSGYGQFTLGQSINTGSKIIITPKKGTKTPKATVNFSIIDPKNITSYKDIQVEVEGKEERYVDLNWDNETIIVLPDEAVGKYIYSTIKIEGGQQQKVGEFTVTVE